MRRRGRNNEGSIFKPGCRRPAMLREAGDEEGARKAEAELARTSWYIQYTDRPGHTAQPESARTLVKAEAQALLRKRVTPCARGSPTLLPWTGWSCRICVTT